MNKKIEYLNTDLDLQAFDKYDELVKKIEKLGLQKLTYDQRENGWFSTFERCVFAEDKEEPETTISIILNVIESNDIHLTEEWKKCSLRELNIGYECGDEPWEYNHGLTVDTLKRMANLNISLRMTIYPNKK
ncbi:MAG: hypothetical protein H6755_05875 [Candidatus Omnitrophica bacterium]|nr:hypothetical protein [Candidatus Omnitrophota bacterium]MCB9747922.1 hypothetical protein [Candidatus Omnitrophota bacterium]